MIEKEQNLNEQQRPELGISDVRNSILKRIDEHAEDMVKYEKLYKDTKDEMYVSYVKNYSIRRNELKTILQYCF